MTLAQLEKRIESLESEVARLKANGSPSSKSWWRDEAGRFADDPIFEEIVQLGRKYRESLRPWKK